MNSVRSSHRFASRRRSAIGPLVAAIVLAAAVPAVLHADANGSWTRMHPRVGPNQAFIRDDRRQAWRVIDCWSGPEPGVWAQGYDLHWEELQTTGNGPTGLRSLAGFYDNVHDRYVVIDRFSLDAWWLSSTDQWTLVARTLPSFGVHGSLAFDSKRGMPLVFQENSSSVWALSEPGTADAWRLLRTTGAAPSGRMGAAAIYDPDLDRLVVQSGFLIGPADGNFTYHDTWALPLDTLAWHQLPVRDADQCSNNPWTYLPYQPLGTVYDHYHHLIWRFRPDCTTGGLAVATYAAGDSEWRAVTLAGTPPPALQSDPIDDGSGWRLFMYTGNDFPAPSTFYAITTGDNREWQQYGAEYATPIVRKGHATAYDADLASMFTTMGAGIVSDLNDTWQLSFQHREMSWAPVTPTSSPPARHDATLVDDSPFREELMLGGEAGDVLSDLDALYLQGRPRWSPWGGGENPALARHTAIAVPGRRRMVVFGGVTGEPRSTQRTPLSDTWTLDERAMWTRLATHGATPPARGGHVAIYDPSRHRMIVHGGDSTWVDAGGSHRVVYGDTWALSLDDTTWTLLEAGGPRRTEHSAVYDAVRDRMVVYGGRDENGELSSDVWALSLADGSWSQLIPAGRTPLPRAEHTAIYDPEADRMIVFGGATRDWRWPVGDTWVLDFGATAMPDIRCGWVTTAPRWSATFVAFVTNRMGAAQDYTSLLRVGNTTYVHSTRLGVATTDTVSWAIPVPDSIDGEITATFDVRSGVPLPPHVVTSTLSVPSFVRDIIGSSESGQVHLTWHLGPAAPTHATVYRRIVGADWVRIGEVDASAGSMTFADPSPPMAIPIAYRLGFVTGDHEIYRGEVQLVVPGASAPELLVWPNPAPAALSVAFTNATSAATALELFDVTGRHVLGGSMGTLKAGPYVLKLAETAKLDGGVYFLRLTRGQSTTTQRVCLVR